MKSFTHISATTVDEALSALQSYGQSAHVMAGGQDLLFRIKKYIVQPACIIDLKTIPGLNFVGRENGGALKVGALATLTDIASSREISQHYTVLAEAARSVASPQIRNLGTLGGNLCQDVWCWYLQDGFSCWKSGGKFCDLAAGDSRYYGSVMGGHLCLANHPSDVAPALAALDARVFIASPRGQRSVPILDFLRGHQWVGTRLQSHALEADEIVTAVEAPFRPNRSHYLKFSLRKSWDFAIASVAVAADMEDGVCNDLRIVLGGVATYPWRSLQAESLLRGKRIDEGSAEEAGRVAFREARPLKVNGYKVDLGRVLVRRALLTLSRGPTGNGNPG